MIKPPSNQKQYDVFYSRDPAIISLPDEATDEQRRDLEERLDRARDTGEWSDVTIPGEHPTRFTLRPLPSQIAGELGAMLNDARLQRDQFTVYTLAFLLSIVDVKNLPDAGKIDFTRHPNFGRMATSDFLDRAGCTGQTGSAIMIDLGSYALYRARAPSPKS